MAAYESIASTTLTTATSTITFSSIPGTYEHLQLRIYSKNDCTTGVGLIYLRMNNDTASNYAWHLLNGNGASGNGSGATANSSMYLGYDPGTQTGGANMFGCTIIEIADYASSNKYKTVRSFTGEDRNGAGTVGLHSGLWLSTTAINRLDIRPRPTFNFVSGSVFALYGYRST